MSMAKTLEAMKSALVALTNSIDLVRHEYTANWRHGIPARAAQLEAMKQEVEAHDAAIAGLRDAIVELKAASGEPFGWHTESPGSNFGRFTRSPNVASLLRDLGREVTELFSHPAPARGVSGWQPIETAPRDGSIFLAYRPLAANSNDPVYQLVCGVHYVKHVWPSTIPDGYDDTNYTSGVAKATHWLKLEAPQWQTE